METNEEHLEESCWEDGECENECDRCNNMTDRCCISCESRIGCLYLCRAAKLQQEHELKSDEELIKLFGDWSEEDIRYLYAEDRIRSLSQQLAAANTTLQQAEARAAALRKAVEWMKQIGDYFEYKAPEQIDGCRLIGAMSATAKDALGNADNAGAVILAELSALCREVAELRRKEGPAS